MPVIRSLFFAPANRPDLVAKFPRFGDYLERDYERVATVDGVGVYAPRR